MMKFIKRLFAILCIIAIVRSPIGPIGALLIGGVLMALPNIKMAYRLMRGK